MKVLFNVAPLGAEDYNPLYKTGIYRVIEQLTHNLVRAAADPTRQLEVIFHSTHYAWAARRYFQSRLRGPGTRFAARALPLLASRVADSIVRFCVRTEGDRRLALRALRWALTRGIGRLSTNEHSVNNRTLAEADIYHSPFLAIPSSVPRTTRLRRFTTVYDLIPITHPEYFESGPVEIMQGVVGGFQPDDFVTCISHATRASLLEHAPQLAPERVFVTHLAAGEWCRREEDPARIAHVCARFGLTPETPYFLTLCTLEPRKNLETVIRAFAHLRQQGKLGAEHRLVLAGNKGWKIEKILGALEEAKHCRDAIVMTGFVPDEELPALYSGTLAFLYLSRLEGFGLPPLEAMQCGAPVITSNASSLPEVVGDAGFTCAPDDVDGLAAHMLRLSQDDALRRELSARSLARAKLFSWARFGAETLAAYRAAMAMS